MVCKVDDIGHAVVRASLRVVVNDDVSVLYERRWPFRVSVL